MVFVDGRMCDSRGRSEGRWTRAEVHRAARALGLPTEDGHRPRRIDAICLDLAKKAQIPVAVGFSMPFVNQTKKQNDRAIDAKLEQRLAAMNANRNAMRQELANIRAQLTARSASRTEENEIFEDASEGEASWNPLGPFSGAFPEARRVATLGGSDMPEVSVLQQVMDTGTPMVFHANGGVWGIVVPDAQGFAQVWIARLAGTMWTLSRFSLGNKKDEHVVMGGPEMEVLDGIRQAVGL